MGLLKTHFAILDSLFFDFLLLNTDGVLKADIQNVYCNVFMNANSDKINNINNNSESNMLCQCIDTLTLPLYRYPLHPSGLHQEPPGF